MHTNSTRYSREVELSQIEAAKLDPSRFAPLYEAYYKPVFLFILNRMRDKDTTADLTAQVFLKAMLNIGKYRDQGYPFSAWLYRIAFNEMNMLYRKSKNYQEVEINESDAVEMMGEMNEKYSEEKCLLILEALSEMPGEITSMVELRFMQKLSFQEISAIFGISEANAKMKLYRALEKLKAHYEKLSKGKE